MAHSSRARILPGMELEISTTMFSISDYFQEKLMIKFLKKPKKPHFGAILGPYFPDLGKNEFSWKKVICQFLNIPIIYHHAKKSEKTMTILGETTT